MADQTTTIPDPVRKTIRVACKPDKAFRIFTADIDRWWPKDRNSLSAGAGKVAREVTLEPGEGGRILEVAHDGEVHHWASITRWEPGQRLSLAWHIMVPPEQATQVDVTFKADGDGARVDLVHDGWEKLADPSARDGYAKGWVHVFEERFAEACAKG